MTEEPLTDAARWRAILDHAPTADGLFWYGVKTTGIYCRPSCPSRRPKQENVVYFACPQAAEAAGFRACRRCEPARVAPAAQAVARAQALLDEAETEPTLDELAAHVGLSSFHLQRIFKAGLGVSPKQYAIARRAKKLKQHLKEGRTVTTALYDAGHDSPSTLYARNTDQLGMSPRQYARGGEGEVIYYDFVPSPIGTMLVAATARGLCSVQFGDEAALLQGLRSEFPRAVLRENRAGIADYLSGLERYFRGQAIPSLNLDARGTAFQERVWAQLRAIPPGETRTYSDIARAIGDPDAVRAVARACATNPVGIVIPCHRVVRKGGALSGYRWGVNRKRALLEREAHGAEEQSRTP